MKEDVVCTDLTLGYGSETILEDIDLSIQRGEIVGIMGPSGCGKSTLLKALTGLLKPLRGKITIGGEDISSGAPQALGTARLKMGVLFQSGALIGSMTVADNIALPLRDSTDMPSELIDRIVQMKLEMVNLGGAGRLMPSELSGGMNKRAGLARAIALDPPILFCDEPSAGLDPLMARGIEELLLQLNKSLGMTIVIVTHQVVSIQNLSGRCIMLNAEEKGIIASGPVHDLTHNSDDPRVRSFFKRRFDPRSRETP